MLMLLKCLPACLSEAASVSPSQDGHVTVPSLVSPGFGKSALQLPSLTLSRLEVRVLKML